MLCTYQFFCCVNPLYALKAVQRGISNLSTQNLTRTTQHFIKESPAVRLKMCGANMFARAIVAQRRILRMHE